MIDSPDTPIFVTHHAEAESGNDWQRTTIGSLIDEGVLFVKNGFPQGKHNLTGTGVPHLRPFNVTMDGNIDLTEIKYVESPKDDGPFWIRQADVIFNNTNSEELVGKTAYFEVDGRFVLSNHMTLEVRP